MTFNGSIGSIKDLKISPTVSVDFVDRVSIHTGYNRYEPEGSPSEILKIHIMLMYFVGVLIGVLNT